MKHFIALGLPLVFASGFIDFAFPNEPVAQDVSSSASGSSLKNEWNHRELVPHSPLLDKQIDDINTQSRGDGEIKNKIIQSGKTVPKRGLVRRAYSLEELMESNTTIDKRAFLLDKEAKKTFALAMADMTQTRTLVDQLPLSAAAYRLTRDSTLKDWIVAQLTEVSSWDRLQREGWTLTQPGIKLPKSGDGTWLGTGWGIRAIADTLEILPRGVLPDDLKSKIEALLIREIERITDDWKNKRQWFVRNGAVTSNQWVIPTAGLIRACIVVEKDRFQESYELGVTNILATLDAIGSNGEWDEGLDYAVATLPEIIHTARAMASIGDDRLINHRILRMVPTWLAHHFQPGKFLINSFDSHFSSSTADSSANFWLRELFSLFVTVFRDDVSRWALWHQLGGPRPTVAGAGATLVGPSDTPPVAWGVYERAARVNWRSSWEDDASGIWIRGGHEKDFHDHSDRGHVSFTISGKPILIEAGTPDYGHPELDTYFKSAKGHNVLEVESNGTMRKPAPITIQSLGKNGGSLRVDASQCYPSIEQWTRDVEFAKERLLVRDEVIAKNGQRENLIFRWHLGTPMRVTLTGGKRDFIASWDNTSITIRASAEVRLEQYVAEDRTLNRPGQESNHVVLEVRSKTPVSQLTITTEFRKTF